jgi:hypothetical protein
LARPSFVVLNMAKKLFVALNGGLGNQMFQYAAARALALRHQAELVVDNWSGFVRDYEYHRHYELGALPIQARTTKPLERLPIWLYRMQHRQGKKKANLFETRWYGNFITETKFSHLPQVQQINMPEVTWLLGYWQSPLYFRDFIATIRNELMPTVPTQANFTTLGEELLRTESVALGVRLYEESATPQAHAHEGRLKGVTEIRAAVERMKSLQPRARFYIFCTHRSPLLEQIGLPNDSVSVTHDDGYEGTLERLWLLSRCRHHIITNSSYYWWGAVLSAAVRGSESQQILAADNFVNQDGLLSDWNTF